MLSEKHDLMIHDIQTMLDSVSKEKSLRNSKAITEYDGSLTLLVNFGTSLSRNVFPTIQVEIYSESLGPKGESLHLFSSIEEAYSAVKEWHSEYSSISKRKKI